MRNPVDVLLEPWRPTILRACDAAGLTPHLERIVRWLNDMLTRRSRSRRDNDTPSTTAGS